LSPAPMGSGGSLESVLPPPLPAGPATIPAAPAPGAPAAPVAQAKPKPKPIVIPRETALSTNPEPTFTPQVFFTTAKASERYAAIADAGGWPTVPAGLGPGSTGKGVAALRKRLAVEGDLGSEGAQGDAWGADVSIALKKFQDRMGLKQSGLITPGTLKALNIPAATRFKQLASSAQRVAGINFQYDNRYVVVNIPSATVEAIEHGRVARRYVAVVGDPDHRSPEESTRIQAINLNPYWTLPTSIIKNEVIPKMRRDPGYLSRAKIRILDNHGAEVDPRNVDWQSEKAINYTLRQDAGSANALGNIRINMPNKDAVYMHDTPSKKYFGGDYRFLSHGCVRVEGVYDLASWLLDGTGGAPNGRWDKPSLLSKVATGEHVDIKLANSVPVIWVYMTGWANPDGVVHFRDDIYEVDKIGGRARSAAL
jgi:murein L,D-transpeptidase YcbB/YkuD